MQNRNIMDDHHLMEDTATLFGYGVSNDPEIIDQARESQLQAMISAEKMMGGTRTREEFELLTDPSLNRAQRRAALSDLRRRQKKGALA